MQLVSESIAEDLPAKQAIFEALDGPCGGATIFTTNTSGLSISRLAAAVSQPQRFAGLHCANPAHIIPVAEIIKGERDVRCHLRGADGTDAALGQAPGARAARGAGVHFQPAAICAAARSAAPHRIGRGVGCRRGRGDQARHRPCAGRCSARWRSPTWAVWTCSTPSPAICSRT